MSQSISLLTASPQLGRGNAQHQQHQQHCQPLRQQQQQQVQRYRDSSAANRTESDGESLQHRHQQQQQQRQRSRRPRSIHITLRKTRAGSRPVNIQRSQNHFFAASGERVGSPTGIGGGLCVGMSSSSGTKINNDGKENVDAYPLLDNDTPLRTSPTYLHTSPNDAGDTTYPADRASRAGSNSDAASGQHACVPGGGGGNNAGRSLSSSFNGFVSGNNGGGGNASVGPSSGSGCVPQLNTFMKAPRATLQQLLPPGMRDRANVGNSNGRNTNNRVDMETSPTAPVDVVTPSFIQQNAASIAASNGNANRLRSRSQVYIGSSTMPPMPDAATATAVAVATATMNAGRLRSNSSVGQFDGLAGSYSGVLGDFVFPYPDRSTLPGQPRTPLAAAAANTPNVSLDSRSPRLSPPVRDHVNVGSLTSTELQHQQAYQQRQQHMRARSYTAGGSHHHRRSANGPVITASMAGAGGAALFAGLGSTPSMGHAESYTSHNLERSLSLSSSPVGFGVAGTPRAAGATTSTSTTAAHPNVNVSRSSLHSGTTRGTTPVNGTPVGTTHGTQVPVTPLRPQQQQSVTQALPPQQHRQQQQQPPMTHSAADTPAPQNRCTRKSGSFVTHRSASSDVVNGLDDSVDSVLSSSTPRCRSANGPTCTHRYVMDSVTSDNGMQQGGSNKSNYNLPTGVDSRRAQCDSTTLTDEDDNTTTVNNYNNNNAPPQSTLDRLRARRDNNNNNNAIRLMPSRAHRTDNIDVLSEPKTAIERWRAQEEQKRREEALQACRHRLSARQWREAFRRLGENRMRWTVRSFIGAGTSGKVYEGVLEDAPHTPVAVKVLDVGVPMPVGPGTAAPNEDGNMSPAQQEALLVLLREVEMMEKLHQDNIVTCLRCQVTPVHDRFVELHRQQQRRSLRPSSQMRLGDDNAGWDSNGSTVPSSNVSPQRNSAPATRIPVQVEIIMELCKRGTLASVVRRSPGGQLPVVTARRYLRDVLKGLAYLHRNNFIHRDVKGENVLISADDVAKLADFGCSRRIVMTNSHVPGEGQDAMMSSIATTHATDSRYTTADYQWCEATGVAQTMVGTPMFMAPEIIQASGAPPASPISVDSTERGEGGSDGADRHNKNRNNSFAAAATPMGYTASADIWSFGCLVLEVFGRTPWPTAGNNVYHLMKQIEQSVDDLPPGVPKDTPVELLNVLRCCFHRDPHRRSTARALLRSPWMTCKDEELEEMPPRRRR